MNIFDRLLVGATFTIRPLERYLGESAIWHNRTAIDFIPYNQLLQTLLDIRIPSVPLLLIIRAADWFRTGGKVLIDSWRQCLNESTQLYRDAISAWRINHPDLEIWCLFVPGPDSLTTEQAAACVNVESTLRTLGGVHWLNWSDFPTDGNARLFDPVADKLGHIPLTEAGWRHLVALLNNMFVTQDQAATKKEHASAEEDQGKLLERFFERLRLEVILNPIVDEKDSAAAARISHTAATFHATGHKFRTEAFMEMASVDGRTALAIECRDRFGDYGFSGFMVLRKDKFPIIEEFVLSCVVLGKQVEYCLLHAIAHQARKGCIKKLGIAVMDFPGNQTLQWIVHLSRTMDSLGRANDGVHWFEPTALIQALMATVGSTAMLEAVPVKVPESLFGDR